MIRGLDQVREAPLQLIQGSDQLIEGLDQLGAGSLQLVRQSLQLIGVPDQLERRLHQMEILEDHL